MIVRFAIIALAFAVSMTVGADACDDIQVRVSTTPIIVQSPARLQLAMRQQLPKTVDLSVLIVGDSIAHGWSRFYERDFPGLKVYDLGVPGDRTQALRWRLQNLRPKGIDPKQVVLFIGTNNLSDRTTAACGIVAGIRANINDIKVAWPKADIFLMPILPRGEGFRFRNGTRMQVNEMLSNEVAGDRSVTLVKINERELTCNNQKNGCDSFRPDKLHPSEQGYMLLRKYLGWASIERYSEDRFK